MSVEVFKNGVSILVEPEDLQNHLDLGYSLTNGTEAELQKDDEKEFLEAVAAYEAKFGEKPHHKMKLATILEKINDN